MIPTYPLGRVKTQAITMLRGEIGAAAYLVVLVVLEMFRRENETQLCPRFEASRSPLKSFVEICLKMA